MNAYRMTKTITAIALGMAAVLLLTGCPWYNQDYKFDFETIITDVPVNLEKLNTEYDDYNSVAPYFLDRYDFYFSTNRKSKGGDYDIVCYPLDISYHRRKDTINISMEEHPALNLTQRTLLGKVNNPADQLGPNFLMYSGDYHYFFYAENESGNFDIKFVYSSQWEEWGVRVSPQPPEFAGPYGATLLNSAYDDLYPTFYNRGSELLFCSNREDGETFSIYGLTIEDVVRIYEKEGVPLHEVLMREQAEAEKVEILSATGNDKCPFVLGNVVVFTSDREGGAGGFDLYYAKLTDGRWGTPVSFGPKINSAYNEYRPMLVHLERKVLLFFSSDRPGGKGGYDLYCVDVSEQIPEIIYYDVAGVCYGD